MQLNKLYNMDCMEGMKQFPDKYFELAIVDPPYGLGDKILTSGGTWAYEDDDQVVELHIWKYRVKNAAEERVEIEIREAV